MNLQPTHTCFDDAIEFIEQRLKKDMAGAREFILVHGILLAPSGDQKDVPFAHAWVEDPVGLVWQAGLMASGRRITYGMPLDTFRNIFRPQRETRYSLEEAWKENERSGHLGPWAEEYQALCGSTVLGAVHVGNALLRPAEVAR